MAAETQNGFVWDDLKVLLALSRQKTLSGAGAKLGVNPSTVGRRLDALETALGAHLFDRTPDGVLATAAAERLIAHAEMMEHAATEVARAIEGLETTPEGTVRITATPGIADHFLAPALPRLRRRYPGLTIEVDSSVGYADLTRREADLALRVMRPTGGDLITLKIADEDDALLGSPRYVKSLGSLGSLDDAEWIAWGDDLAHIPSALWLSTHVSAKSICLKTSSLAAQIGAARAGLGLVMLSRPYMAVTGLAEVKLQPALRARLAPTPRLALWLVGHRALRDVPRIAAVWRFIVEEMERHRSHRAMR